jgi:hypothetical protein
MSQAGLLLIVRRYSQQPVNINTWHIATNCCIYRVVPSDDKQ